MTIEQSHGKARPTLPRSSDLSDIKAASNPSDGRGAGGRFAAGNSVGIGAREKNAIKRLLGPTASSNAVIRDARKLFAACLRDMPSDGANVRQLVALQARHGALAAYYAARAAELGLDTVDGAIADDRAMKHGQRAERLAVTSLDIATKLAAAKKPNLVNGGWLTPPEDDE